MSTFVHSSIDDQELVAERRTQLVAAATKLFSRNSYETTTMKEISKHAGFSSGLIYSYVQTKEDMLFLVLHGLLDSYRRKIPRALKSVTDPVDRFCMAVRSYCREVDAHAEATLLAYRATKSLSPERKTEIMKLELETNQLVARCIEECIDAGYFRAVNVHLLAYQVVVLAHGWSLKRWVLGKSLALDQYVDQIIDLFLRGAMTDSGWDSWSKREKISGKEKPRRRTPSIFEN